MVSGKTLSARAAAARTRIILVGKANDAQTTDDLETMTTNLARLFPTRRATRTHVNARGVSAGQPDKTNPTTQSEQGSNSQLSGTFPTRDRRVREVTRIQKLYQANQKRAVGEILNKDFL